MTASGVLRTLHRERSIRSLSHPTPASSAQTSSSTGGPVWVKPAGRSTTAAQVEPHTQRPKDVTTVVTASGVLRTVANSAVRHDASFNSGRFVLAKATTPGPAPILHTLSADTSIPKVMPTPTVLGTVQSGSRGLDREDGAKTAPGDGDEDGMAVSTTTKDLSREDVATTASGDQGGMAVSTTVPEHPPVGNQSSTGGLLSVQSRLDLSTFISTSVLPKTNRVYEKEWLSFKAFVKDETGSDDPFLTECTDDEKASLVALMMMRRHQAGKRGKSATAFTAAVRQMYARMMRTTAFLDSSTISTARTSCLMKPDELRALKDKGPSASVKLPICEGILADLRLRSWPDGWSDESKRVKAIYVGTMYGFETAGRASEFTHCELGNQDHCARVDDFTFTIESSETTRNIPGSGLVALRLADSVEGRQSITECRVRTVSSKGKVVIKPKLIARRSPEEAEFLDDLAAWITYSGTTGRDEVFSFRKQDGNLAHLTGRAVRDEIKKTCASNGLPPDYFSAHSLRKGAITHMRAQGATEDDRRDRGNYAAGSTVMNGVYDYATGLGPLASNSLEGGHRLDKKDLKRLLPPGRKSV